MNTDQFIDAYSDDAIYIKLSEELINKDDIESLSPESIKYSFLCRALSVNIIGSIEMMIKKINESDEKIKNINLDLLDFLNKGLSNKQRGLVLKNAFKIRGLNIEDNYSEHFEAIKIIRNCYIHSSSLNDKEKEILDKNNYPTNMMKFQKHDFDRMFKFYQISINSIGMSKVMSQIIIKNMSG